MKCSWFLQSLRMAVLGGVTIACSVTGGRLGNAAVVGADLPSWMASLTEVDLYDYRTTCEGDGFDQPSPWLASGDESYSYDGGQTSFYEADEYQPYAEESTTTEESSYGESSGNDYNYESMYGEYGEYGQTDTAETEAAFDAEDEVSPYRYEAYEAPVEDEADESESSDDYSYRYEYSYARDKYGYWADTATEENDAANDGMDAEDETAEFESDEAAYESDESSDDANGEMYQEWRSSDYGDKYNFSTEGDAADAMTDESEETAYDDEGESYEASNDESMSYEESYDDESETSSDDEPMYYEEYRGGMANDEAVETDSFSDEGESFEANDDESMSYGEYQNDMDSYSDDEGESFEASNDESMSYDDEDGMESDDGAVEESYSDDNEMDETADDEARWESGPQTYICGSLAETYEPAAWSDKFATDTNRTAEFADWQPDELLTDSDRDILRQLGHLYEESQEVRRTMLNDYIETLGWEALKLAERFEDCSNVEFLGFSEDLPSLAALLATFRRLERDELTMDEAVDLLSHNVGYLPEQWIDAVDTIVTEDEFEASTGASYSLPQGNRTTACQAIGLWLEQSWDNASVSFRNIAQQIADVGGSLLSAHLAAEHAVIEADYPWYYDTF